MSLYQDVRPGTWDEVVGNAAAVGMLRGAAESEDRPHAYLLHGPSGCGKTTLARVLARSLGVEPVPEGSANYMEVNGSNNRGIEDMRRIVRDSMYEPIIGGNRVVVIDECHMATRDAQNCLLKPLEDSPPWQYYVLCTTEPQKLLRTIRNRCAQAEVVPLDEEELLEVLIRAVGAGGMDDPGDDVLVAMADRAAGCPRSALTMLEQARGLPPEQALEAAKSFRTKEKATIDVCRLIAKGSRWSEVAAAYNGLDEKQPETVRRTMLGYLGKCLAGARKPADAVLFAAMIEELAEPTYNSGEAGLLAGMFRASQVGKGD